MTADDLADADDGRVYKPWVRFVWWPLMVVVTLAAVACALIALLELANGRWVSGLIAGAFAAIFGYRARLEWPNRRAVDEAAG